jgi:hypothetical protein
MNQLKDFFDSERQKFLEPDAFFTQRVMSRLSEGSKEGIIEDFGIWEALPSSTRPVLAFALVLILCFIGIAFFVPQQPQSGMVESFLAPEQNPAESFLYNDTEVPSRPVLLEQLIALEEQE